MMLRHRIYRTLNRPESSPISSNMGCAEFVLKQPFCERHTYTLRSRLCPIVYFN